ncbi:hypothetical protein VPH35_001038 [Triticum aestivum]
MKSWDAGPSSSGSSPEKQARPSKQGRDEDGDELAVEDRRPHLNTRVKRPRLSIESEDEQDSSSSRSSPEKQARPSKQGRDEDGDELAVEDLRPHLRERLSLDTEGDQDTELSPSLSLLEEMPQDVIVSVLRTIGVRSGVQVSSSCSYLREFVMKNAAPCCGRYLQIKACRIEGDATIATPSMDLLCKVMSKLDPFAMSALGGSCLAFRCLLASPPSRGLIEDFGEKRIPLGALTVTPISPYPVLLSSMLPARQRPASDLFAAFRRRFAAERMIGRVEISDCRDGLILLKGRAIRRFVVFAPLAANMYARLLPQLSNDGDHVYMSASVLRDKKAATEFSVTVLMGDLNSANVTISQYQSKSGQCSSRRCPWLNPATLQSQIKQPSVLCKNSIWILQPMLQLISVDPYKLTIGTLPFPPLDGISTVNHALLERAQGSICLVMIADNRVMVFELTPDGDTWSLFKQFQGPPDGCQLIGTGFGKILVHSGERMRYIDIGDGIFKDVSLVFNVVRQAWCYDVPYPPMTDLFRRLQ